MFFANVQIPVRVDNICCLFCLLRSSEMCVHVKEAGWERESVLRARKTGNEGISL